jgi:DNA-binding response OmpR family regulator
MPSSILILDPDAFLAGMYARRFEARHWRVRVAESLEDANKAIERELPQVLLLDLESLPEGIGALRNWRSAPATAGMKLAVLTRLGDRDTIGKARREGADAYLLKGHFVPSEVCDKIEALVAESGA